MYGAQAVSWVDSPDWVVVHSRRTVLRAASVYWTSSVVKDSRDGWLR